MHLKEEIKNIKGNKLIVAKTRLRGHYYINSNRKFEHLLDDLQVRLIALDVRENEEQDLTVVLKTDYNKRLVEEISKLQKVIRFKIVEL